MNYYCSFRHRFGHQHLRCWIGSRLIVVAVIASELRTYAGWKMTRQKAVSSSAMAYSRVAVTFKQHCLKKGLS